MQRQKLADDPPSVGLDSSQMSSQDQPNPSNDVELSDTKQHYAINISNDCTYPAKPRRYDIVMPATATLGYGYDILHSWALEIGAILAIVTKTRPATSFVLISSVLTQSLGVILMIVFLQRLATRAC